MQTQETTNITLEQQIGEINGILKELQYNQKEGKTYIQKNHATYMKKLDKLQEFNKISDMTNQVFEKRLFGIEQALKQLTKTLGK